MFGRCIQQGEVHNACLRQSFFGASLSSLRRSHRNVWCSPPIRLIEAAQIGATEAKSKGNREKDRESDEASPFPQQSAETWKKNEENSLVSAKHGGHVLKIANPPRSPPSTLLWDGP
jgi:hypothetical protein